MGITDDNKKLCEDITASYDSRKKAIEALVRDVQKTRSNAQMKIKEFVSERKKISEEQKKVLSDFTTNLSKNVDAMIREFHNVHTNMSMELKKDLTDYVAGIESYVENKLKEFNDAHTEMSEELRKNSEELRKELANGEIDRLDLFKSMREENRKRIEEINKRAKEIEIHVKNKLKEFHDDHADMSKELKKNLTDYVKGIVSETKNLLTGFEDERKRIADDLQRMAANWQNMSFAMAERRGIKAEVKVKPVEKVVEEKKVKEKVIHPENDLEEKVLKFIKRHPKGIKVGDMEESFGLPRMRLGQIAKKLFDDGKVRKEENLYLPL